jgi:hypothetical protein
VRDRLVARQAQGSRNVPRRTNQDCGVFPLFRHLSLNITETESKASMPSRKKQSINASGKLAMFNRKQKIAELAIP